MKTLLSILTVISLFSTSIYSQTVNHPTVEKVQTIYKPVPDQPGGSADIKIQAKTSITLKNGSQVNTVYLKVFNTQTNTVMYEVNYALNSPQVVDANGNILFKKENNIVTIINPSSISLKPYGYEIYTKDAQGTKSIIYSIIQ